MRPRVSTVKHIVQFTLTAVPVNTVSVMEVVDAVSKSKDRTGADQVDEGAIVSACMIEMWLHNAGSGSGQFIMIIVKLPSGVPDPTSSEMLNLQSYENKKNILFTSQGVLKDGVVQSVPISRGWYKIPRGKQRFGLGDKLIIAVATVGESMSRCGVAVYKEQN